MKTKKELTEYGQILQHIGTVTKYITDLEKDVAYFRRLCHALAKMLEWETQTDVTAQEWLTTAELWLRRDDES